MSQKQIEDILKFWKIGTRQTMNDGAKGKQILNRIWIGHGSNYGLMCLIYTFHNLYNQYVKE